MSIGTSDDVIAGAKRWQQLPPNQVWATHCDLSASQLVIGSWEADKSIGREPILIIGPILGLRSLSRWVTRCGTGLALSSDARTSAVHHFRCGWRLSRVEVATDRMGAPSGSAVRRNGRVHRLHLPAHAAGERPTPSRRRRWLQRRIRLSGWPSCPVSQRGRRRLARATSRQALRGASLLSK
jgi:hypothetical protein